MTKSELAKIVEDARCKVFGWEDASNDGHRLVLATLIQAFNNTESAVLCEPSLARKTNPPPDIVLIDPEVGVHIFEVKGIALDQIEAVEPGGTIRIQYPTNVRTVNPIVQVRNAMFDIKHASKRVFSGEFQLHFNCWIVFPLIRRASWFGRFGEGAFCPPEYIFADTMESSRLARHLNASDRLHSTEPIHLCPLDQLQCVWSAFGDSSVLYAQPHERESRKTSEGTLGEHFDEAAEAYKALSDEQQRLSAMAWDGPRQIRGVAGSGKTIVLANNLARRLERMLAAEGELFDAKPAQPRLLAVCFNRTLAPLIRKKINGTSEKPP